MCIQVYQFGQLQYEFDSGDSKQDYKDAKDYISGYGVEWCIKHKCKETNEWSNQVLELYEKQKKYIKVIGIQE